MKIWRTTIAGCILGGIIALQPILSTGQFKLNDLLIGFAVGAIGFLAKDAGVTGAAK